MKTINQINSRLGPKIYILLIFHWTAFRFWIFSPCEFFLSFCFSLSFPSGVHITFHIAGLACIAACTIILLLRARLIRSVRYRKLSNLTNLLVYMVLVVYPSKQMIHAGLLLDQQCRAEMLMSRSSCSLIFSPLVFLSPSQKKEREPAKFRARLSDFPSLRKKNETWTGSNLLRSQLDNSPAHHSLHKIGNLFLVWILTRARKLFQPCLSSRLKFPSRAMYLASRDYFWAAAAYSNFNFHELIKYRDAFKDLVAMGVGVLEYIRRRERQ